MTPKNGAAPIKRAGNTLSVLRRQDGAWVISRTQTCLRWLTSNLSTKEL